MGSAATASGLRDARSAGDHYAEGVGFEPTDGLPSCAFKAHALGHYANPPVPAFGTWGILPGMTPEEAFHAIWTTGCINEDWARWPDHLTEDVLYVERIFGTMHGREAVRAWITDLMSVRGDVHGVLNWYMVKGDRIVLNMTNRYYHPDPAQPPIDFGGLSVLEYAGNGLFGYEEDYWDTTGAKTAYEQFTAAVAECGGKGLNNGRYDALEAERKAANHAVLRSGG